MLHRVGDVDIVLAIDADLIEHAVEISPGGPDERMAGQILLIAGLLADEHHEGVARAFAENGLRRVAVQVAAVAVGSGGAKLREREALGKEVAGRAGEVAGWGRGRSWHRGSVVRTESV